ncbi:antirestriction protein ArdA [Amycolatopsis azurea]|uniref:antirestriction protein ArdA n=1 Tax=Amycolatopsis azurea TaxID=36819 RepID=UPI00381EEB80
MERNHDSNRAEQSPEHYGEASEPRRYHPRLYITDVASQARGIDFGLWIDANQSPEELDADIAAMLASSPTIGAADWAVRNAEDFAGLTVPEAADTAYLSRLGSGVARYGEAFAAYVSWCDPTTEQLEKFADYFVGTYRSLEAWGLAAVTEMGWPEQLRQNLDAELVRYLRIDYAAWARDAIANPTGNLHATEGEDGIHVFRD